MRFVLRMAWREMRASWLRLVFFFLCVAIGVAAIIALRSVIQNVRRTMTLEARSLIGADILIQSPRALDDAARATLEGVLKDAPVEGRAEVVQTLTMMRPPEGVGLQTARMAELRGVDARYPFYGTMTLASGRPYSHALLADHGAIVQPDVLAQLGVNVGDSLIVAGTPFVIRDVVTRERVQRSGGVAFGPRVYIDIAALRALPVLGFGSRATHQLLLKMNDAATDRVTSALGYSFRHSTTSVRSWKTTQDRLGRALTVGENYLSLVGFAIVVLGGIGVWSVTRVFVQQKLKSIAVLKCVGASNRQVLGTYVLQILMLSATGCVVGAGISVAALAAVPRAVLTALGVEAVHVTVSAVLQGTAVGLLVALLFALVPLLEIRRVKPLLLMRADSATTTRARDWRSVAAAASIGLALSAVAMWQAGSLRSGLYVSAGLGALALVLHLASHWLVRGVAPLTRSTRFALRHATVSLGRPGNQTRVILMAVGLGAFFILAIRVVQANLLTEFSVEAGRNSPDLVLIDVQSDQVDAVTALIRKHASEAPRVVPMMRARIVGVSGRRVQLNSTVDIREKGNLGREYGITYRNTLEDNERITAGRFWRDSLPPGGTDDGLDAEVSIEESLHDQQDLDIGDEIRFDIAGRVIRARVTSIRKVTWDNTQNGGFMFVFRPGPIEKAPHAFLAFVLGAGGASERAALQRDLAVSFPNVSAIDVRDVLRTIQDVLGNVTLGITVVGAVVLVSGVLILVGAVAMTKFQRVYDAAIYRTLGAGTWRLAGMVAIEYGVLGTLAGILGAAGAAVLSYAISRRLLDIAWHPSPVILGTGVAGTAALVTVVGLMSSLDVLVRKPLGTLRAE
jgi:putative ABC transport system permease protein